MFWHEKVPITGGKATMERSLSMEVVRVTEAADNRIREMDGARFEN